MKQILRKQAITILFLLLGGIIGLILYSKQGAVSIWYVQYQFNVDQASELPLTVSQDTLFEYEGILFRNFTASKADTSRSLGIARQELKVYGNENQTKHDINVLVNKAINEPLISISNTILMETKRKKIMILHYLLIGFFLGMLVDFFIALKKKPST